MDDEMFRARLFDGIQAYARVKSAPQLCTRWKDLGRRFRYVRIADASAASIGEMLGTLRDTGLALGRQENLLIYLATPPVALRNLVAALAHGLEDTDRCGNAGWTRVVLEKPFGLDAQSA